EEFLLAYRQNESLNSEEVAIFDLKQEKIVSPWIERTAFELHKLSEETLFPVISYSYTDASKGLIGFFMEGMSTGTELLYTTIELAFPFVLCSTKSEIHMDLFMWSMETCALIAKEKQFFPSSAFGYEED